MQKDTSPRAGSAKGGKEVLIAFSPEDINDLRMSHASLVLACRQYEEYHQLGMVVMTEAWFRGLNHLSRQVKELLDEANDEST